MRGESGFSRRTTSPITRTVPELPKACSQPSLRNASEMGSSSSLTAVRARSKRFSDMRPSSKKLVVNPTHPTDKLSSNSGLNPSPMTTSVEPPPMSITRRLSGLIGLVWATPE